MLVIVSTAQKLDNWSINPFQASLDTLEMKYQATKALVDSLEKIAIQEAKKNPDRMVLSEKYEYFSMLDSELQNIYMYIQRSDNHAIIESKIRRIEEIAKSAKEMQK